MEEKVYIQMFGFFEMKGMDGHLSEGSLHSDMLVRLLSYLFFYRSKRITSQELIRNLWEEEELHNPSGALKNLIYRLRMILKKEWPQIDWIKTGQGCYQINPDISVVVDVEIFESNYDRGMRAGKNEKRYSCYKEAIALYQGQFLQKLSDRHWVIPLTTYFHSLYLNMIKDSASLLEEEGRYQEMESVCSEAIQRDYLDESLHCMLIRALLYQKKQKLAAQQYEKAKYILYETLGIAPSAELVRLQMQVYQKTFKEKQALSVLQKELSQEGEEGVLFCEFEVFKKLYAIEKRQMDRTKGEGHFALITVKAKEMPIMKEVLAFTLRCTDAVAKFSEAQYAVLLPGCSLKSTKAVLKRVEENSMDFNGGAKIKMAVAIEEIK